MSVQILQSVHHMSRQPVYHAISCTKCLFKCQGSVSCHPFTFQKTFFHRCVQGIGNSLLKQCAVLLYGARVPEYIMQMVPRYLCHDYSSSAARPRRPWRGHHHRPRRLTDSSQSSSELPGVRSHFLQSASLPLWILLTLVVRGCQVKVESKGCSTWSFWRDPSKGVVEVEGSLTDTAVSQKLPEIFSGLMIHPGKPACVTIRLSFGFFWFNFSILQRLFLGRNFQKSRQVSWFSHSASLLLLLSKNTASFKYHSSAFEFSFFFNLVEPTQHTFHAIYKIQVDFNPTCSWKS